MSRPVGRLADRLSMSTPATQTPHEMPAMFLSLSRKPPQAAHRPRRAVLAAALLAACAAPLALAQGYPSRPIRLLVGFPPGTAPDFVARTIAPKLQERLGVGIVVDNKPGAAGMIAAAEAVRAAPDGYTLFLGNAGDLAITPQTYRKPPFDAPRDFAPVSLVSSTDFVLVTNPQTPAKSLKEYLDWARGKQPLLLGTFGAGSIAHFGAATFGAAVKTPIETVHYRSTADAVAGGINGDVHGLFVTPALALPQTKAGRLKAIASTGAQRSAAFAETPTFKELGYPDVEFYAWFGVVTPGKTPADVLDKLNAAVVAAAQTPEVRAKLEEAGMRVMGTPRAEFARLIQDDAARWSKVIAATGFRADE